MELPYLTIDANEAVARVAYALSEVIAIYPITPASPMGEWADAWFAEGQPNLWGTVPQVIEMQSEGGAAGVVHGALQTGALTTTFTASQGLLLMLPNMYKIAGELTPAVFHVAARSLAAQGLSIFGDHSDVMAARATGWAMLCSASVQEAQDFALIAQMASLKSRLPFLHFFDGFRTSHEIAKIEPFTEAMLRQLLDEKEIWSHRNRALTPERPVLRGTAQNPDVYFQARESVNSYYLAAPALVQEALEALAQVCGRSYQLYEYHGSPQARRVLVLMGSGCETAHETVDYLVAQGQDVGVLKVRLYRPWDARRLIEALPATVQALAVLDRTKEPGSLGEPLYLDVLSALVEAEQNNWGSLVIRPRVFGGRYGLSSKEFTPAMVKAIFENLASAHPKNHFTVGIEDDVTHSSLSYDPQFSIEPPEVVRAIFYGLGADGTVGANKNSIKIIGENTSHFAQGYFVYDSKKAGAVTVSHLRFGEKPIRSAYLVEQPNFVACHQPVFLERYAMLETIVPGGVFLLNTPHGPGSIWPKLPLPIQQAIVQKNLRFYVIDALRVARESGMAGRLNTVMQVCFFAISGALPHDEALEAIRESIRTTYRKKGERIVAMNLNAVEHTLQHLHEVTERGACSGQPLPATIAPEAPFFVRGVLGEIMAGRGNALPVSAFPVDGTYPTGTARWEKRNLAEELPVWDSNICIQCGKCVMVCPHSVIRSKVFAPEALAGAPPTFKATEARDHDWQGWLYALQVAPEDCTGCGLCVDFCPVKNKAIVKLKALNMQAQPPLREAERQNWEFFLKLPLPDRRQLKTHAIHQQQMQEPLFEFSGACAGCGETPYLKLLSQLFGDRALIANATGCSSIYGGNLPTTPWSQNAEGRGPAWSNSLFEDNAEFGLGFRVSLDKQREMAAELLSQLVGELGEEEVRLLLDSPQQTEAELYEQRQRVKQLKEQLRELPHNQNAQRLLPLAETLVRKSVWIVGGDGWAYDIGFGGLDHVLASGRNINVLVLDTEVYSNTGGQTSKATPRGAVAKFSAGGKPAAKKDLGLMAMSYGNVYVASVAMGAKDEQTLRAFLEAEAYPGPSLIIAYSHCIAHGIEMKLGMQHQKAAVQSGQWLLYRFHPERGLQGENPLTLDSPPPRIDLAQYRGLENRFKMLTQSHPQAAQRLLAEAQQEARKRRAFYEYLAERPKPESPKSGRET